MAHYLESTASKMLEHAGDTMRATARAARP
jgi:hypothetical protein